VEAGLLAKFGVNSHGLAVMTKFYPLVLLPALFRRGEYRMPATLAAVIAFGYACYSGAGMHVFGFLRGYAQEEGMETGTRYFLLELTQHAPGLHGISTGMYLAFAGLVFAVLTVWCWQTCCNPAWPRPGCAQTRLFGLPAVGGFLIPAFSLALALMLLSAGIVGTATGIGASLSTVLAGYVSDRFGSSTAFTGLAVVATAGLAMIWFAMPETRRSARS